MRFSGAQRHSLDVEEWLWGGTGELYSLARIWFTQLRKCGPDVNELLHDGCPVACVGDAAFAYVNVFKSHMNVGFFLGATVKDPTYLLGGTGKRMRHVKVRPGMDLDNDALKSLIREAYLDMQSMLLQA
jgi:hypothetical protein